MAEPLAQALQTKMPVVPKGQRMTGEQISSALTQFQPQKAQFEEDIAAATGEEAMAKQKQAEIKSAGMMGAEEAYGKAERGAMQQFEERKRAEPLPAFIPTQDTAQDIAGLFSLINVIGLVVGGRGKQSAQMAMNAMNGMLEGYQKGRGDLYKRERDTFEKNFKTMIQKHKEFREDMEDAIRLAATDKRAGIAAAEEAAVKAGSDIIKAQIKKGNLIGAYNNLKETEKSSNKALEMFNANINAERQEEAAERRHRQNLEQARQLAVIRAGGKDAKPPPKEIVAQNQLRNTLIPKIEESLPVLDRLNKEGKWNTMTTLLAVDPRAAELQFKNDPEALSLILTLAYFRSKEFETAGKALTKKEDQILAPIVRGDLRSYEGLKNAMESGLKTLKSEQKGLEATYPFIKTYNDVLRGEAGESAPPAPSGKPMPTGEKLKAYAKQHFNGDEAAAIDYLRTQGYQ